ncbi:hypothetical protein FRC06_004328, partial [Ceratobasidium sp. 370]
FRTLGVISIFIAGVEAQCFTLTSNAEPQDTIVRAINALIIIGLLFSSFGAVTALLSARWFDLLNKDEVELLQYRISRARMGIQDSVPGRDDFSNVNDRHEDAEGNFLTTNTIKEKINKCQHHRRNWVVAKFIFIPLPLTLLQV